MDEYFCPNCNAILNDQYGFEPSCGYWTCTECGKMLMDDSVYDGDVYEGVAWFCDCCGALLNKQSGFSDGYDNWICTECSHTNPINENEIYDSEADYQNKIECPNCRADLNKQSLYSSYEDYWECTECGAKLHRDYSFEGYSVVEDYCPNCEENLMDQFDYFEHENDWKCINCGAQLHRNNAFEPFEIVQGDEVKNNDNTSYYSSTSTYVMPSNQSFIYNHSTYENCVIKESKLNDSELRKKRIKAFIFKRKKIKIKYGYADLLRRNIEYVEIKLYNQAFNNIKTIPIKDIYIGSKYKVGEVEQVVIAGSSYFNVGDMIPYDAEIIITYHVKREITIPFTERKLRKLKYMDAVDKLQGLGFTEIYGYPIRDIITGWIKKDGKIEKITIGDVCPFRKNSVFAYDTKISIEYHTFKNIKMS